MAKFAAIRLEKPCLPPNGCQLVNLDCVYGPRHVEQALLTTGNAFKRGTNTSKKHGIEFLLRITGERQIKNALKHTGSKKCLLVCFEGSIKNAIKELNAKQIKLKPKPGELKAMEKALLI